MDGNDWTQNPALNGIDPAKLQMLTMLAGQAQGKKQSELLPFLMAAAAQTKSKGLGFTPTEIEAVIGVMKIGKSPQEIQKMNQMCAMIRQLQSQQNPAKK